MRRKKLDFEPLVPWIEKHVRALNKLGIQKVPKDGVNALAVNQAKTLAYLKTTAADLKKLSPLEFQSTMDFATFQIENLDDGGKLNFLNAVGHPLSNDELLRYFFGK